ncbi:MAG: Rv1355c family protein [Sporocytophaga sp.]|uniref:Rv1355c family protein n=1 Tax=Sporocytophaga sp. TaxID=2231183 RepID=UPI001B08BAA7|nr:Rv1355c family protein [Sporocytophaga sp.]MBO9699131.1 Rv1355c family protein [Sporocytophaga sp.]
MHNKLNLLIEKTENLRATYKPLLFRLNREEEFVKFNDLLKSESNLLVFDELRGQVKELIKLRNPKTNLTQAEMENEINKYFANKDSDKLGVWAYYPWANKIVHLLDEEEFVEVRTNRNFYKITPEEKDILAQKKVGIIGLSVGQSVSMTMAMERSFGEIRLADFDILELSNYNRIRTPLSNLGVSKAISVAREIAEIDPYLNIKCFPEGLNQENMDKFFCEGGKLDLLIDECDGFDIKILARVKAKELKIPVVMEASDRCMLDVERFDLEPERPLLHGLVGELNLETLKSLKTNEEKIPYLLAMIGVETISTRLKSSMLEIEETITTWPQLASAVTLGGGITADICRRIFTDEFKSSGRYYVDLEELICDDKEDHSKLSEPEHNSPLTKPDLIELSKTIAVNSQPSIKVSSDQIQELVSSAILAPSGGNNQPWKWLFSDNKLYLYLNPPFQNSLLDFDYNASTISLGAATENLLLKAKEIGLNIETHLFPNPEDDKLAAIFNFIREKNEENQKTEHGFEYLSKYIDRRNTNRSLKNTGKISSKDIIELTKVVESIPGASLQIISEEEKLIKLGMMMGVADRLRVTNPKGHAEFVSEIRWSKEESEDKMDGIPVSAIDFTPTELIGYRLAKDWKVVENLIKWNKGKGFEKLSRKLTNASSAFGLITMPSTSKEDYFKGGRALQRLWLHATSMNINIQPNTALIFLFAQMFGQNKTLNKNLLSELNLIRPDFESLFNLNNAQCSEIFLFRLFKTDMTFEISKRKPIDSVLYFN